MLPSRDVRPISDSYETQRVRIGLRTRHWQVIALSIAWVSVAHNDAVFGNAAVTTSMAF